MTGGPQKGGSRLRGKRKAFERGRFSRSRLIFFGVVSKKESMLLKQEREKKNKE
jgi:hypothetical protein